MKAPPPAQDLAAAAAEASDLQYLLRLLHWTGTMRNPRAGPWASRAFRLLNAVAFAIIIIFQVSQLMGFWRGAADNLERFILFASHGNSVNMWMFRLAIIAVRERDFHYLEPQVERDFAEFLTAEDIPLLRAGGLRMRRVLRGYMWFGIAGSMWWLLYSVVCFGVSVEGLPYLMALPFDVTRPLGFFFGWLLCTLGTLHAAIMTMVADSYIVSLMIQLRMQLEVLSKNLVALGRGRDEAEGEKCPSAEACQLQDRIRQNIRHHQAIIRNTELLEKNMGATLLAQCVSIGTAVCIQLFQVATHTQRLLDAGKFCCYLSIMLGELFLYCWFGDDFMTESLKVSAAAYDCVTSLDGCPDSTKKPLVLLMLRAQTPLRITAAGLFPLCRESFVGVVNMSYSFFAILRNFKEEDNS